MNSHQFAREMGKLVREEVRGAEHVRRAKLKLIQRAGAVPMGRVKIKGYRLPDGSAVCVKHRYKSAAVAAGALAQIAAMPGRKTTPVRVYFCSFCRGFHLTSKPD